MTKNGVWRYKLFRVLFLLCIVTPAFAAGVYLCPDKEGLTYQELPCRNPALQKVINIDPHASTSNKAANKPSLSKETEITLTRDPNMQFHVEGTINDVEVKFLIDTGANITAIPEGIAASAKLPMESKVVADTADGSTVSFKTTIDKLKIGKSLELENVPAAIIKGKHALLGMNVLAKFNMTQKDDTLTLKLK